jgi:hypothetical protein
MNSKTKVIIVLAVLLLSLGPFSFFFNSQPQQINLPTEPGQGQASIRTFEGNLTGTVVDLSPFISYVGIASTNNAEYVKAIMNSLNYSNNYTVTTTLNPIGKGYRYEVTIFLKDLADMEYVGFRAYIKLSSFLTDASPIFPYPRTVGKVLIDPIQFVGENTINAPSNLTVSGVMLYSEKIGAKTSISCPEIITSLNYNIIRVSQICGDNRVGAAGRLGLSFETVVSNEINFAKNMDLQVVQLSDYTFEFNSTSGNFTELSAALPAGTPIHQSDTGRYVVSTNTTDLNSIRNTITSAGFTVAEEYRLGLAGMPETVEFVGVTYSLSRHDVVEIKLKPSEGTGKYNVRAVFYGIFGEIVDLSIERN